MCRQAHIWLHKVCILQECVGGLIREQNELVGCGGGRVYIVCVCLCVYMRILHDCVKTSVCVCVCVCVHVHVCHSITNIEATLVYMYMIV